jgi:hypothetical protein
MGFLALYLPDRKAIIAFRGIEIARMNPMQEVILDRLIGAPRKDFETHVGPVGLAVQALVEASLVQRGGDPHRLGYPLMLLHALEGACSMLRAAVEDQRRIAVNVFTEVAASTEPLSFAHRKQIKTALWCAKRVHPLICRAECPYLEQAVSQIERYLQPGMAPFPLLRSAPDALNSCSAGNQIVWDTRLGGAVTIKYIGRETIENVLKAARADQKHESVEDPCHKAGEYAGRLVAMQEGVPGSIGFCLDLARELGI